MPGWLQSEQVAGFGRNRWLVSSECAIASLEAEIAVGTKSADRRKPYTLSLSRHGAVLGRVTILADGVLDAESLAGSDHLYEQCGTNMSDETVELSVEEAA